MKSVSRMRGLRQGDAPSGHTGGLQLLLLNGSYLFQIKSSFSELERTAGGNTRWLAGELWFDALELWPCLETSICL